MPVRSPGSVALTGEVRPTLRISCSRMQSSERSEHTTVRLSAASGGWWSGRAGLGGARDAHECPRDRGIARGERRNQEGKALPGRLALGRAERRLEVFGR